MMVMVLVVVMVMVSMPMVMPTRVAAMRFVYTFYLVEERCDLEARTVTKGYQVEDIASEAYKRGDKHYAGVELVFVMIQNSVSRLHHQPDHHCPNDHDACECS